MNSEKIIHKTKKSILWSILGRISSQLLILFSTFILARLISPAEYGLIAMITVFSNFAILLVDFGFSSAIIFEENLTKRHINSVFFVNITIGSVLTLLFVSFASLIADFYNNEKLINLIYGVSPIFLIASISGVNKALARKKVEFKTINIIDITSMVFGIIVAILLAINNFGPWSIIGQMLTTQIISTLIYLKRFPVKQQLKFHKQEFMPLFHYGKSIAGQSMLSYWTRSGDQILIGKLIDNSALGLYTKAYSIIMLPISNISNIMTQVMFPSFSTIRNQKSEIKKLYLKSINTIAFITIPLMTFLSIVSYEFVMVAFGKDWIGMSPLLKYFCIIGGVNSILALSNVIYNALGKPHVNFRITLFTSITLLTAMFVGIKYNRLEGMLQAYSITIIVTSIINWSISAKMIELKGKEMLNHLKRPLISSLILGVILYIINKYLSAIIGSYFFLLLIESIFCFIIYLFISLILQKESIKSIMNLINKKNF